MRLTALNPSCVKLRVPKKKSMFSGEWKFKSLERCYARAVI